MLRQLGKIVAEKIVSLVILVLFLLAAWTMWRLREQLPTLGQVGSFVGRGAVWLAVATLLPWATFFLVGWVQRAESNGPAVVLLIGWAAVDFLVAWWLAGGPATGVAAYVLCALATLLAGLYNLIAANQISARCQR